MHDSVSLLTLAQHSSFRPNSPGRDAISLGLVVEMHLRTTDKMPLCPGPSHQKRLCPGWSALRNQGTEKPLVKITPQDVNYTAHKQGPNLVGEVNEAVVLHLALKRRSPASSQTETGYNASPKSAENMQVCRLQGSERL